MPLPRAAESFLNEYRGRRNDGRITNEEHLIFLRNVQADAIAAERASLLERIMAAANGQQIPTWLLQAVATAPPAPALTPALAHAAPAAAAPALPAPRLVEERHDATG